MLKKIFSQFFKSNQTRPIQTSPLIPPASNQPEDLENDIFNIQSFTAQSIGKVRSTNEDSVFAATITSAGDHHQHNFGLFIMADGMGGHVNGEVASNLAVTTISAYLLDKLFPLLQPGPSAARGSESLHEMIQNAINHAQDAILRVAPGAGTTVTLAIVLNHQLTIAQIGDSRCYSVDPLGRLSLLTRDHSLVTRLVEIGNLTPAEAVNHPQKHVLYKALGQKGQVEADIESIPVVKNSGLLLCSDGLWGVISDEDMTEVLRNQPGLAISANTLVSLANNAGGPDNISLILVRFT